MHISPLYLLRTFNRAFKRAGIDILYTKGFNPRPKVSFALPLSVGTTSESEYMDIELNSHIPYKDLVNKLNHALPEGIQIIKAKNIDDDTKSISSKVHLADYKVKIVLKNNPINTIKGIINNLLKREELKVKKYSKRGSRYINITPHIHHCNINKIKDNVIIITLRLDAGSVSNLNTQLFLQALENNIENFIIDYAEIHRLSLLSAAGEDIF